MTPSSARNNYVGLKSKVIQAGQGNSVGLLEQSLERTASLEDMIQDMTRSLLFSRWMGSPDVLGSRKEVGFWLNSLGLGGEGVEIGVFQGDFSHLLLNTWRCSSLLSVYPWRHFPASQYLDACNMPQSDHDSNHRATVERPPAVREAVSNAQGNLAECCGGYPIGIARLRLSGRAASLRGSQG